MSTLYRDVELGVCVMDDGWALLVNPKNELNCVSVNTPPKPPALVVPTLSQEVDMARDFDPRGAVHNNRQRRPTPHGMTPSATLPGHNLHQLVAPTSSETENPDLVIPPRRQSLSGDRPAPPSAYLRPVPGRPVSVVSTPVTQAPVSCLRRKSLPPDFDGSRRE